MSIYEKRKKCLKCKSYLRSGFEGCFVCEYKEFQEKKVNITIKDYDYQVILSALEFSIENCEDFDKQKEFREVLLNWVNNHEVCGTL